MTHILIVEDDLPFGTMMQTWLKKKGFETSRATSVGAAARLLTDGTKPDLVLSDLRLPDHDGLFLLGWMRKRGHNAPFIVITNYAEVQNAVLAMKLGAADYIAKPVQPDILLQIIKDALAQAADTPFFALDCGAIPKDVAASEFFGHKKGSFTVKGKRCMRSLKANAASSEGWAMRSA